MEASISNISPEDLELLKSGHSSENISTPDKKDEKQNPSKRYTISDTSISNTNRLQAGNDDPESKPITDEGWAALDFKSPAEIIAFFDPNVNSGEITLHKWQVELQEQFAAVNASSRHPHKFCLCAANGSGKDAFIVAPFVIWLAMCRKRSLSIITSSSGVQLSAQTENYIRTLANRVNTFYQNVYGCDIFKINQRFIRCRLSGSEIRLFATDEEGKAEGYHPLEPNAAMAIVINEAKSVSKEIYQALRRCTGYSYWLEVSTPGEPFGDFYKHFTSWPFKKRITYYDCSHLSPEEFESDKLELGEHSPLFRSKWLALFTTVGGQCVVPQEALDRCISKRDLIKLVGSTWEPRIGIDLSVGGDETVLQFVKGNKQDKKICFRITDATRVADRIDSELREYGLDKTKPNTYKIFADDGGVGKGIIDILQRKGWTIHRVLNQSRARSKSGLYRNRGAELWYKFQRLVTECLIILEPLPDSDNRLYHQIISRHYKQADGLGGITLLSKAEEKADGIESPDRADALILAFSDLDIHKINADISKSVKKSKNVYLGRTPEEIVENYEDLAWKMENNRRLEMKGKIKGSLQVLLKQQTTKLRARFFGSSQSTTKVPIIYEDEEV